MAIGNTKVAAGLTVQQWDDEFFTEYLTENRFAGEFGTDENSIIQVKEDLAKKPGDRIYYALVNKLTHAAVLGDATLENNEEKMNSRSFYVRVNKRRNGVRVAEIDEQYSAIGLRSAAKVVLKDWSMKDTEKLIINALASSDGLPWKTTAVASLNPWLVNNTDHFFTPAGGATSVWLTVIDALDVAADSITAADITAMKYKALVTAKPHVRPVRLAENGRHYFVLYLDPRLMRDLKAEPNSPIMMAQREVNLEKENNRLFEGGDLLWNGIIIKEVHEMFDELGAAPALINTGAVPIGCAFLCGAQAIGCAYAKRWRSREQTFDYGDKQGVAIDAIYGIDKMRFGTDPTVETTTPKDHGVITGLFATSN